MVGPNTPRDTGLNFGSAKGRPDQTPRQTPPPAKSWLARLRAIGPPGAGWIDAPLKAVRRTGAAAVEAAADLVRGSAGFAGGIMRWEALTALAAVLAAAVAVFAWSQSVDTETRQVSSELLNRFNSDEMWKARLTLERYYYLLSGDKIAPADLARLTEEYFRSFGCHRVLR